MNAKEETKSCGQCNFFSNAVYGRCILKGIWFGAEDSEWIYITRPKWCPMNKETEKDEDHDCISKRKN
jgi:hypothetical protein